MTFEELTNLAKEKANPRELTPHCYDGFSHAITLLKLKNKVLSTAEHLISFSLSNHAASNNHGQHPQPFYAEPSLHNSFESYHLLKFYQPTYPSSS